jgi:hypothetical protein
MDQNKFVAGSATMDTIDYAYPCFHQNQFWNGWVMPYFSMRHAKLVANEFNGEYDEQRDAFIFDNQGEEDVYTSFVVSIEGENVKLYGIGAGYWCWELIE